MLSELTAVCLSQAPLTNRQHAKLVQVGAGPAGWHRWGVEVADTAQDTVSAWLRAHTANARAPVQQAAGSSCRTVHAFLYGPAEASAQPCSALGRQRVYGGATTDDCDPQQRWIQHRGESGNELPLDDELDGLTEESAKPGGHMRPAMFAEKGCTTTMAAEHRHWLRLIRQHLQVNRAHNCPCSALQTAIPRTLTIVQL